ncbi:exo-alpha-sialidase [Nocardioides mesophilus]|uniref:exo-alpha-sialidase n=1 Tax=Nocardioides mesophilus TaxID=433659 RepID=A0A7G9RGU7_9ACTN|nr:exo-alpha-sialidase [Nocardioides mesophilus]
MAGPVHAYPYTAAPAVTASGPSPFSGCTVGQMLPDSVVYPNTEVEPFVAVNPTNPDNVIGVFQQDRWSDGGARGLVTARSSDGGLTWSSTFAAFSACAGGTGQNAYERASDPWVTFDPSGNAYQISLSVSDLLETSAILVSKSTDGGATWDAPKTLLRDTNGLNFNDKESITADPTRDGYVYAVWDRGALPGGSRSDISEFHSFAYRGQPMFSRSTDHGATWSAPVAMSAQNVFTLGNQVAVLPDGTLVDVFWTGRGSGLQPSPNQNFIGVMTSRDAGLHWSPVTKVANFSEIAPCGAERVCDPDTGQPVRAGTNIPDIAVDGDSGRVYVVWADGRYSAGARPDVVISQSSDGGRSWSAPAKVNGTPVPAAAFNAAVEVSSDGTVGVSYYDFRSNDATPGLPTDAFLAHSHDNGATWSEQHIGGPFDMEQAPFARGLFLGDYQGLDSAGQDFLAFFSVSTADPNNRADVVSVRLAAP